MRRKDMQAGTPLFYERGHATWRNSVHGDGMAFILDPENSYEYPTHRWSGSQKFRKVAGARGRVLIIKTSVSSLSEDGKLPPALHEVLSTLRVEHLDIANGYQVPSEIFKMVREMEGVYGVDILAVPAAQLKGTWAEVVAERRAQEKATRDRQIRDSAALVDRKSRWSKITGFLASLNGNYYYKEESNTRLEVRLEDMEKIMSLLHAAYPDMEFPVQ